MGLKCKNRHEWQFGVWKEQSVEATIWDEECPECGEAPEWFFHTDVMKPMWVMIRGLI